MAGQHENAYVYLNCADQQTGVTLESCDELTVSFDYSEVMIGDIGSVVHDSHPDANYFVVHSPLLSIAIPRNGYSDKDQWTFRGLEFRKIKKQFSPRILGVALSVDVVTVSKGGKPQMTFWYSKQAGVQALSFGPNDVYYCAEARCLFDNKP